ncbi:MAG: hypothetical protein IPM51_15310 [Sphingobacteriaceae bacterium]|nr:hypothetical protein [Sphingobacteriaceae bacterium]
MLADKGYNNERKYKRVNNTDKESTIVAQQEIVNSNDKGTTKDYLVTKFRIIKRMTYTPARKANTNNNRYLAQQKKATMVLINLKYRTMH